MALLIKAFSVSVGRIKRMAPSFACFQNLPATSAFDSREGDRKSKKKKKNLSIYMFFQRNTRTFSNSFVTQLCSIKQQQSWTKKKKRRRRKKKNTHTHTHTKKDKENKHRYTNITKQCSSFTTYALAPVMKFCTNRLGFVDGVIVTFFMLLPPYLHTFWL